MPYEDQLRRLNFFSLKHRRRLTTFSTVALTCHKQNFLRRQRSETFEDTTSRDRCFAYTIEEDYTYFWLAENKIKLGTNKRYLILPNEINSLELTVGLN